MTLLIGQRGCWDDCWVNNAFSVFRTFTFSGGHSNWKKECIALLIMTEIMTSNNENPFPDPHNKSYIYRFHLSTKLKWLLSMAASGYKIMTTNALSCISIFHSRISLWIIGSVRSSRSYNLCPRLSLRWKVLSSSQCSSFWLLKIFQLLSQNSFGTLSALAVIS